MSRLWSHELPLSHIPDGLKDFSSKNSLKEIIFPFSLLRSSFSSIPSEQSMVEDGFRDVAVFNKAANSSRELLWSSFNHLVKNFSNILGLQPHHVSCINSFCTNVAIRASVCQVRAMCHQIWFHCKQGPTHWKQCTLAMLQTGNSSYSLSKYSSYFDSLCISGRTVVGPPGRGSYFTNEQVPAYRAILGGLPPPRHIKLLFPST